MLLDYSWPGNVRELENAIEHASVLARGNRIEMRDLPISLRGLAETGELDLTFAQQKQQLIDILNTCGWNKKMAAKRLGISRSTLYERLKKYKINTTNDGVKHT